jgi:phage terminase large subunit
MDESIKVKFPPVYRPFLKDFFARKYTHYVLTGGRGSAKSYTIGNTILIAGMEETEKVMNTREIQNSIKESVHSLFEEQIFKYKFPYTVKDEYIYNPFSKTYFLFRGLWRNVDSIKSIPGITLAWQEEAHSISQKSLKKLIPTIIRNPGARLLWTLNPDLDTDPVYEYFFFPKKRDDTFYLHTTFEDNPYCSSEIIEDAARMKSNDYAGYCHTYLGELNSQGDNVLITIPEYNLACERIISDEGAVQFGVDLARYGDDDSVISKRKGHKLLKVTPYHHKSGTEIAGIIMNEVGDKSIPIKMDGTGIGGPICDIVKDAGYNVIEINFGEKASDPDRYNNVISEMWKYFKENIADYNLIRDDQLKKELTRRKYKYNSKGQFCIESKEDYKKREGKSPDHADSVLLCFFNAPLKSYYGFV